MPRSKKRYEKEADYLRYYLGEQKPFLNNGFAKKDLCRILGLSVSQLHTMLMRNFSVSYSQLMNILRVEEAKKLLADPVNSHLKKDRLAEKAGFTSMSQFNVQFKLVTGMTPTEYQIFYQKFKKLTGENPDSYLKNGYSHLKLNN